MANGGGGTGNGQAEAPVFKGVSLKNVTNLQAAAVQRTQEKGEERAQTLNFFHVCFGPGRSYAKVPCFVGEPFNPEVCSCCALLRGRSLHW